MDILIKGGTKYALANHREAGYEHERNDCTVRALKNVTGVPYRDAHSLLKSLGRRDKHGMPFSSLIAAWAANKKIIYGMRFTSLPVGGTGRSYERLNHRTGEYQWCYTVTRPTTAAMLKRCKSGRYIVIKRAHTFAIIDGVIHDQWAVGSRSQVLAIYKVEPSSIVEARGE